MFKNQAKKDSFVYSVGLILYLLGALISSASAIRILIGIFILDEKESLFMYLSVYVVFGFVIFNSGVSLCKLTKDPEAFFKNKITFKSGDQLAYERSKNLSERFLVVFTILLFALPDHLNMFSDLTFPIMIFAALSFILSSVIISHYKKQIGLVEEK